jgi:hypothetical protein
MQRRFSRLSGLALSLLFCTSSLNAQPVTMTELVAELTTMSAMLRIAQAEYQTVSSELLIVQTELSTLTTVEIPRLRMHLSDLTTSFTDYRRTVSREIRLLKTQLALAVGASVILASLALILAVK